MIELPNVVLWAIPGFLVTLVAEFLLARRTGRVRYETRDTWASLSMGMGNLVAGALFGGLVYAAYDAVYQYRLFEIGYAWWAFVLCFFAEDLAYYWFHRISHERRWFWASHVQHHSSRSYNLSTALRQPWTGLATGTFIWHLPLPLLGFPPPLVLFFQGISLVYQYWIHTEAIARMPRWFESLLNTPSHHRVHHATNPRYLDANYAGVLILWDRIFGTFAAETDADRPRYGIVKPLETYNPLRIAFHEWATLVNDLRDARSGREALAYLFGPPGWSPDGSRQTTEEIKAAWRADGKPAAAGAPAPSDC